MRAAIVARGLFLASIIAVGVAGEPSDVLFYGAVFIATLPLLLIERTRRADAAINALFAAAAVLTFTPVALAQSIGGLDKLFHILGGAAAAYIILTVLAPYLPKHKWTRAVIVVCGAVAIGAWWEVFEWAFFTLVAPDKITPLTYTDTMLDLIADTIGAAAIAIWPRR